MNLLNIFNSLTLIQKGLVVAILSIVLFVTSAGVSFSVASSVTKPSTTKELANSLPNNSKVESEDPTEPKTEGCPLNGSMHTKKAKDIWSNRRPLAVMIENHLEARPQSGLSYADIVYEAVAEGGITRFMGIYLCNSVDVVLGPVRSARTYFLDWLSPYDPLYSHVGGANMDGSADALGQIITYKLKDLNQMYNCCPYPTYARDYQRIGHPVATEHTMYSSTEKLWSRGVKFNWTATDSAGIRWDKNFTPWKFKDTPTSSGQNATDIMVNFWQNYSDYSVNWKFDAGCGCYKRKNGGTDHLDLDNHQQLTTKSIIVQFQRESNANDGYPGNVHLLYKTIGSGPALIFQDGKVVEGTWTKSSRLIREKFTGKTGGEIEFNRGTIWIETVPEGAKISY